MTLNTTPSLAIVGHPNKGKSSIVSTLSQDASVGISTASGTTTRNRSFPMVVDGTTLYQLIDTPGFQRARAAMDWMQQYGDSTADRRKTVEAFVEAHRDNPRFDAECQLLTPILEGAGILYVIDGSTPYGPEYDAEMEILRWTGQPSMALINQIGDAEYFDQWQQPLGQYFKIVRTFDAQAASFERQVQLLTGFSELAENWREPLQQAATLLRNRRKEQIRQASLLIIDMIVAATTYTVTSPVNENNDDGAEQKQIARFQQALVDQETDYRRQVEQLLNYNELERNESSLSIGQDDLFAEDTWSVFGLSRDQLVTTGIVGGAAGGSLLDIGSGGLTLFLGSGLGALVGGASAWFGSQKMVKIRILGLPLGGKERVIGPVVNPNFPWVLLGRAIDHLQQLCRRTHARRDALNLTHGNAISDETSADGNSSHLIDQLDQDERKALQAITTRLSKQNLLKQNERQKLSELICKQIPGWKD